jgi:hypothetical protein
VHGLVLIGPTGPVGCRALPRLAVIGSTVLEDSAFAASVRDGPGFGVVARVPVAACGLALLSSPWGSNVVEYVSGFLRDQREALPARQARGEG